MHRKLLLYCFLYFTCFAAYAQERPYLFQRLSVKDGLFEETVHTVQQDSKGFLWLNFRSLIQRYDGSRFLNFYPGEQLPEGNIRAMAIDKKNRMWLLSGDATLGYLDPDNFKYHPAKVIIPKGFYHIVTGMYLNRNDEVMLVWYNQGFITYSNTTGTAAASNNPFALPNGWTPMHMWQDDALNFWTGTNNGLVKYNTIQKTISYSGHNEDNDPAITAFEKVKHINVLYLDQLKNFWVITWDGGLKILSYNINSGKQLDWTQKLNAAVNKYYVPFGFTETEGGHLWLTGSNLFCKINTVGESVQMIPQQSSEEYSILYDLIFTIYEDKEKNIWTGTNKGLFRFNPQAQLFSIFVNRRTPASAPVPAEITDFLETQNGELLVSTWGSGIFSYNKELQPVPSSNIFQQKSIGGTMAWSMIQRANGDVWCGMQNGVLYIFEAAKKKLTQLATPYAEGKTIRQLAKDNNGNIWIGTHGGALIQWSAALQTFTKYLQVDALISKLFVDARNQLWVGTDRDGLYCINSITGKVLQHYTSAAPESKKLLINGVSDILQYDDSMFYFAGNGLSILNTNTNSFTYFTIAKGLPSANISNLVKDNNGFIWMTSGSGILSYHPGKARLSHYDARDGLPNYSFGGGAAGVLKNGHILFGTNKDIIIFNPADLTKRIYLPPKIHITGIDIMGESKNVDSLSRLPAILLEPHQNSFRVFISALQYKDYSPVKYMLDGIDKSWKKADKTNTIEYNYLPPGKYILKTASFGEDGSPGEITSLTFYIAAPFYRQWWFYALITLAAGGLLFWLDNERVKRREKEQKMRGNIAGNLHKEVNKALSNINVLSEMAKLKADKDIEKSKEFIEQIHYKSQHMMVAMDDMLWSIDPVNDSMEKTVDRMQEYIASVNSRHAVNIVLPVDEQIKKLNPDMELRHELLLLFKYLISSIAEAGIRDCIIQMSAAKNQLVFGFHCNDNECRQQLNNLMQSRETGERLKMLQAEWHRENTDNNTVQLSIQV